MIPLREVLTEVGSRLAAMGRVAIGRPVLFRISLEHVEMDVPLHPIGIGMHSCATEEVRAWDRQDGKRYVTIRPYPVNARK